MLDKIVDYWIRTFVLWCQIRPVYQLYHHHCWIREYFLR